MPASDHNGDERPSRLGYFAAIFASGLGHAAIFVLVFFIAPRFLQAPAAAPPAYTVKIVDNIPAGDLGTHLPPINRHHAQEAKPAAQKAEEPKIKTEPPKNEIALNEAADKNALKINASATAVPTETPTPTPEQPTETPTPEQTAEPRSLEPNIEASEAPSIEPTPTPEPTKHLKKRATPKPTPKSSRNRPKPESTVAKAVIAATPSVEARMAKLRAKLMAEHMKDLAENPPDDGGDDGGADENETPAKGPEGGGPVEASNATEGKGYGVGAGEGSAGILQDPEFILYYKTVQDQIKKAWVFTGGSNDLTATVNFAIGPDGQLHNLKVGTSSNDPAFDDSVLRAIRRAAPFPAPPEKFRDQFSSGINAVFQLGELKS